MTTALHHELQIWPTPLLPISLDFRFPHNDLSQPASQYQKSHSYHPGHRRKKFLQDFSSAKPSKTPYTQISERLSLSWQSLERNQPHCCRRVVQIRYGSEAPRCPQEEPHPFSRAERHKCSTKVGSFTWIKLVQQAWALWAFREKPIYLKIKYKSTARSFDFNKCVKIH